MEKEINFLEDLNKLTAGYFNTLKPAKDEEELYCAEIKFQNYYELGCLISNMIKLCILGIDQDAHKVKDENLSINISLVLETALQLFPLDEFELLTEINEKVTSYSAISLQSNPA